MKFLTALVLLTCSSLSWSQDPGGIPRRYMNDPAVDLTLDGKTPLRPEAVHKLITDTKGKYDISTLDPLETSDLWKNSFLRALPGDSIPVNEMDEVVFDSKVATETGYARFNVQIASGPKLIVMLSKRIHSVLLAKSLLRKIGYQIPDMKYLPKIILRFQNKQEKLGFVDYLQTEAMVGAAKAWVSEDLDEKSLILQDLVVMKNDHSIYNLAVGATVSGFTEDMVQGRRLLSALAVPYAIVNLQESVNKFRWNAGVINNNQISLFLDNQERFSCSWDDARWIARRIEKLGREDWREIVSSTGIPKPVQQILVEKLISRRNSIMRLFKVDAEELPVTSKITVGTDVVDGKVITQKWPGYASQFAHGDPESPLSDSDMKSWIQSRIVSNLLDTAISQINQLPFMGTDIETINSDKFQSNITAALEAAAASNSKLTDIPLKGWTFPTFRGQVLLSRNLVTGTYMGTDNLVNLSDSVGISVGAGMFAGTMGLHTGTFGTSNYRPIRAFGSAEANYLRVYTHLRPVRNIKRALKYPFKNVLVPLVKLDLGKKLHAATMTVLDPNTPEDQRAEAVKEALRVFKDTLQVGESLIVTDTIGIAGGVKGSMGLYGKLASIALGISGDFRLLARFHVHRKDEANFHIYKDKGLDAGYGLSFDLDSLIPIGSVTFVKKSAGEARVKFFNLNLDEKNPKALENASSLRRAIIASSTRDLEEQGQAPFVIRHSFKEQTPGASFLFWRYLALNSSNHIKVTNPVGEEKFFRRHYYGHTSGRNYQAYVNEVIGAWVSMLFNKKAGLTDSTGTNPGHSYKGRGKTKLLVLDSEITESGKIIESFVRLTRSYTGWSVNREKAQKMLEELRDRYRYPFYAPQVLNDTHKIYMYNISLNILFYSSGLEHLLNLTESEIRQIFRENLTQQSILINPESVQDEDTGVERFLRLLAKHRRLAGKGKVDRSEKFLLKAIGHAESKLTLPGILRLVGGEENIYVASRIDGFREGDEDGSRPIFSNSLGEFGSPRTLGPVAQVQRTLDMLEGEFFIYWLMTRLI